MKSRILAFMLVAVLCLSLAACGSSPAASSEAAPGASTVSSQPTASQAAASQAAAEEKVTVDEKLVYEYEGIRITVKGLDDSGFMGPEMKLLIENDSDTAVTVQTRNMAINGYMCNSGDTMFSADVEPDKKTNDSIAIMSSFFERCGIETITDISFSFHIFESESWNTVVDSEIINIYTSAHGSYTQTYDDSGTLLLDQNDIKIIYKELDEDSILGTSIVLYMENNTNQPITVQQDGLSVNGFMITGIISTELMPGTKSVTDITLLGNELEENGIETVENAELKFHIFNTDTWNTVLDTEAISITF